MAKANSHEAGGERRLAVRASAFRKLDLFLLKNHPRVRVLRLHVLVPLSLAMTALAALHGHLTPGAPDSIAPTNAVAAAWFFLACIPASWWMILQWRDRQSLPGGVGARLIWSGLVNFLCLILFFVPPIAYSYANAAAIRENMPLSPVLAALDELATIQTVRFVEYDKHGNVWKESTVKLGVRLDRVEGRTKRNKCTELPSICIHSGYLVSGYRSLDDADCRGLAELSHGSRILFESIYGKMRIDEACSEPEGPRTGEARNQIWINLDRFLVAHGVTFSEGLFRGPQSLIGLAGFVLFLAGILSLAGVLPAQVVFMHFTCCVCLMAFAHTYGGTLVIPLSFVVVFKVALVLAPSVALITLMISRRRSWWSDLMAANVTQLVPVIGALWVLLVPRSFWRYSEPIAAWDLVLTDGATWCGGMFVLLLISSPAIGLLLDRYRNLPRNV